MAASLARLNSAASTHYYSKDNYYSKEHGVAHSSWFGKGAAYFGLKGAVDPLQFKNLMEGKDPSGETYLGGVQPRTRANAKTGELESHRAGVDVTFAPPKSVSIAALLDGRKDIEAAHKQAVEKTLNEIEKKFSICRIGGRGEQVNRVCKNLIVARFEHDTSRSKDPQLHTHCVIISAVRKPDEQWRRINNDIFWDNSKYINDYYLTSLQAELKKINIPLVEKKSSNEFEIDGYGNVLIKGFSKQTQKISKMRTQHKFEAALQYQIEDGRDEIKAQKYVERSLKIFERANKGKELSRDELKTTWDKEKDSLLNINVSEQRFSNDLIISSAGFFAKKSVQLLEKELELTGIAVPVSAMTRIGIGSAVHDVSVAQETFSFSASLVGGYIGGVLGEIVAGPAGVFVGDLVGAGVAQDLAENLNKYISSSSSEFEQVQTQVLPNHVDKLELIERKESPYVEETSLNGSYNSSSSNDFNNLKGEDDMRSQNNEKFKEAESHKDYSKRYHSESMEKGVEKDKSLHGKEANKDLTREEQRVEKNKITPEHQKDLGEKNRDQGKDGDHGREIKEASHSQEQEKPVEKAKETKGQDKDKEREGHKEIDFDDWGRGK